ncbi:DUF3883 domain-containing protein [Paenibacillus sp. LMG 31458]|uniref:DUF3883 domain-containing protein n=1 Tax=Paenibacillus phytorum TaxID=2654977 RepID=A0ABX1Y3M8_9BACL|nr:DUF3883 domain-containing protein [Paenibacillus phytorum]NOU74701.1 DUF3883 domain-containing protein [Paenibacillus phytorum]
MATYLVTWNPERWSNFEISDLKGKLQSGQKAELRWSCRNRHVQNGDRIFFMRQGVEPRGIFASGISTSSVFEDVHFDSSRINEMTTYIKVDLDTILEPVSENILFKSELHPSALHLWETQSSGIMLPLEIALDLEDRWLNFLDQNDFRNRPVGAGFGSPPQNKLVEEAAINEVINFYTENGWDVVSVERDRCGYDLVCTNGLKREDVEVKGVSGSSCNFILTAGELRQANNNSNFVLCVVVNALSDPIIYRFNGEDIESNFSIEAVSYRLKLLRD